MADDLTEYVDRYVQNMQAESVDWHLKKGMRMLENHTLITYRDCRSFAAMVESYIRNDFYLHFAETWDEFCQKYIGEPPEWIQHVRDSISVLQSAGIKVEGSPQEVIEKAAKINTKEYDSDRAKQLGENPAITVKPHGNIAKGTKLNPKGINQHKRKQVLDEPYYNNVHPNGAELNDSADYGDSPEYLAARIARDRPDIREKMKQGEYPSVRAAAVDAGIVKPRVQVTWKAEATPEEIAQAVIKKIPDGLEEDVIKAMMQIIL